MKSDSHFNSSLATVLRIECRMTSAEEQVIDRKGVHSGVKDEWGLDLSGRAKSNEQDLQRQQDLPMCSLQKRMERKQPRVGGSTLNVVSWKLVKNVFTGVDVTS